MSGEANFKRIPFKRTLVSDLKEGQWNAEEKNLATRYGSVKRVRICGTILKKREVVEDGKGENSYLDNPTQNNSRISFLLDDGTGQVWTTKFGILVEDYIAIDKGVLVDVCGIVRNYQNNTTLTLEFIRKIENPNFEIYHLMEVLKMRKFEKKYEIIKQNPDLIDDFNFDTMTNDLRMDSVKKDSNRNSNENSELEIISNEINDNGEKNVDDDSFQKLDLNDKIVQYIQSNDEGDGVSIQKIGESLSVKPEKLKKMLEQLSQDVKIYKVQPGFYSSY
jgi:RPA family protein